MSDASKLQIDDDWKSQAQREKEILAEQVEAPGAGGAAGPMPRGDFPQLLNMLAMQAVAGLGGMRDYDGSMIPPNPELAKFHIDLIDVLDQKTRGNLSAEEKRLLDTTIYELRMAYVSLMTPRGDAPPEGPAIA